MKKLLLLSLAFVSVKSFSQNLVINPSFEDTLQCPNFVSQIDYSVNWQTILNTPDYYHMCNNTSPINPMMVGVPVSARGYQPALSGVAFAGEVNYWTSTPDYREMFYAQLLSPLGAGVTYSVGMHVILNEDNAEWAVDGGLGIYLSSSPINPSTPFAYTPQIMNPLGNVLNDSLNWTAISGMYTAAGGENYITIGSFIPDASLTIINRGGTYPFTSYAIDDVWVIPDSLTTGSANNFTNDFAVNVFPNPSLGGVNLNVSLKEAADIKCEVTNVLGETFFSFTKKNTGFLGEKLSFENLPAGIYYFRVSAGEKTTTRKIVITK